MKIVADTFNVQYTLETLLQSGVIPIINENDTIVTEELTFGDNDMLSAFVSVKMSVRLLIILSDVGGLYTSCPADDADARLLAAVPRITEEIERLATGSRSGIGRGGMRSKVEAAKHATRFGVATVIANGKQDDILDRIASGDFPGTLFCRANRVEIGLARERVGSL